MTVTNKVFGKFLNIVLCLFTIILFFELAIFPVDSSNDNNNSDLWYQSETTRVYSGQENSVMIENEKAHYCLDENIIVSFFVLSNENIADFEYYEQGVQVINAEIDQNNEQRIVIELSYVPGELDHELTIYLELNSGEMVVAMLYVIQNEYGYFISPFSKDDALQKYFDYARDLDLISQEEYEAVSAEFSRIGIIENSRIEVSSDNNINTFASTSSETYVYGSLQWRDDAGNLHPLRQVMIEVFDKDVFKDDCIGVTYSNNQGYYSFAFENEDGFFDFENGGNDIYIKIYAGTNNAMVQKSNGENYCYTSGLFENVVSGANIQHDIIAPMDNDVGRAFQISQAVLTARDYAQAMMGVMPSDVTIKYPYDSGCYYTRSERSITITGNARNSSNVPQSYASWDVIMHEYGHHIAYELSITSGQGGEHRFNQNMCDTKQNKSVGIELAWSEAWPTVFAFQAQEYWIDCLQNIDGINDATYDAYNFNFPYPIESNSDRLGDGCEVSIIAVLWDLYDSTNDTNDTIALGHSEYWYVTTNDESKTFSDFIQFFYRVYPSYVDDIGKNLTYYKMATSKPTMTNLSSVTRTNPPTFTWIAQGGSTQFPNNNFVLIFYNTAGKEILRTSAVTTTSYTLSQSEWNTILNNGGLTYSVAVEAKQMFLPKTGEYISERSNNFAKPMQ